MSIANRAKEGPRSVSRALVGDVRSAPGPAQRFHGVRTAARRARHSVRDMANKT